jgi:hypothetical protein
MLLAAAAGRAHRDDRLASAINRNSPEPLGQVGGREQQSRAAASAAQVGVGQIDDGGQRPDGELWRRRQSRAEYEQRPGAEHAHRVGCQCSRRAGHGEQQHRPGAQYANSEEQSARVVGIRHRQRHEQPAERHDEQPHLVPARSAPMMLTRIVAPTHVQ